jgi:hypothetical protein
MEVTVIDAMLDSDGVYPLRVESGLSEGRGAGVPAALRIAPGAPLYYRTGEDDVAFHDGTEELVIQPVHADMGFPAVRVVALGREGGEHFRARVEMVDLSGVWVFTGVPVSNGVTCSDSIVDDSISFGADPQTMGRLGMGLVGMGSLLGDYTLDASGNGMTWSPVRARWPEALAGFETMHEGAVLVGPDAVQVEARTTVDLLGEEQSRGAEPARASGPAGLPMVLALGGLVPLAFVSGWAATEGSKRTRRLVLAVVVIGGGSLLLAGCFGVDLYGTATADVAFKELEFVSGGGTASLTMDEEAMDGGIAADTEPLWVLEGGEGTIQVDITYVMLTEDEEGNELRSTRRCTGPVVYDDVEGAIFEDVVLNLGE